MPDRMRKWSSIWEAHDLNGEKEKQKIEIYRKNSRFSQKSLLFSCFYVYENISLTNLKCLHIITKDNY